MTLLELFLQKILRVMQATVMYRLKAHFPVHDFQVLLLRMPGTFPVVLLQQANSTTTATSAIADHNKCSSGDIITCIHNKENHHPAKDTTFRSTNTISLKKKSSRLKVFLSYKFHF